MEYQKKNVGAYQLHLIKTEQFKTITFRIVFRRPVVKEEITIRNVLIQMLTSSNAKYPTKRELTIYAQDLYGAYVESINQRFGSYVNSSFYLTILNEKYTEEGMLAKSIDFFHDILFQPNVKDGAFDDAPLDYIKHQARQSIESLKENTSKYSLIKLVENMEPDSPISYRGHGYIEDLEAITPQSLYEYYQQMIKDDMVDIFVIGDIDFEEMTKLIKERFQFTTLKRTRQPALIPCTKCRRIPRLIEEKDDIQQTKLAIGCRLVDLTEKQRNYALTLFNIIFGSSSDSKLFQEVREKRSLAYDIHSVANKLDNLFFIVGGIEQSQAKEVIKVVKEQLKQMQKGHFDEEAMNKAKEFYTTIVDEATDSPVELIESYYMMELLNTDDFETRKQKINQVTKQEIVDVAKKIKIDTIYLLEGEQA